MAGCLDRYVGAINSSTYLRKSGSYLLKRCNYLQKTVSSWQLDVPGSQISSYDIADLVWEQAVWAVAGCLDRYVGAINSSTYLRKSGSYLLKRCNYLQKTVSSWQLDVPGSQISSYDIADLVWEQAVDLPTAKRFAMSYNTRYRPDDIKLKPLSSLQTRPS